LAALSDDAYARVSDQCETLPAALKDVLFLADASIDYAYFPQSGCLSLITVMGGGMAVEVGTVGWEGMAGISLLHGVTSVPTQCIVQVAGTIKRIASSTFLVELEDNKELSGLLHRYAQVWTNQVGRSGSCNAVHSIEERCARRLLLTRDRVDSDVLSLTHEFLAVMLGVRRSSVTLAAESLKQAGLIRYTRGKITVLDRLGLEAASCECYAAMRASYTQLLSNGDVT
jgi:CRP-like cAMP-binding protein